MNEKVKEGIANGMIDKAEIQHEWIELQADAYKLYEGIQATCNAFYEDSEKHFQPFKERLRPVIELMGIYVFDEADK
ncbi:MAG: hypothetical protein IJK79_05465 [Bacteroidales bacterium]|nr:hypothetical protein [Bacteroidales bacterium]